ncbi:MAG TPA: aldehyde dehydrogenase (NADP(+)) [Micromonosporaceae bacterium]|jgi:NADP-dependent aldehyde dehydrogenase
MSVDETIRRAAATTAALDEAGLAGRATMLRAMAEALEAETDALVTAADRETSLGRPRLTGEVGRSAYQLRLFADVLDDGAYLEVIIDHADPNAAPAPRPDLRRMLIPVGPVGVFAASNFPLAFSVPGGDTASALAAGCPVVVKVNPGHPDTSDLAVAALRRGAEAAGLPADVVQVVHGFEAGADLVTHPAIRAIGFTGSLRGGRALFDLANARPDPIPFYGELGSINPLVVTPAAAAERAEAIGTGLAGSFTQGLGQFCTKPGLAFVPAGADGDRLIDALVAAASQVTVGTMLTEGIRDAFGGGADVRSKIEGVRTALDSPRVLVADAGALDDVLLEECFGPLIVVARYGSTDQVLAVLERVEGSLTTIVHCGSGPDEVAAAVARSGAERAGRVLFNGYPTGVSVTWAMQHGGPWPATTASLHTSVGATAIRRFLRPITYQDAPAALLPAALRDDNPLRLPRRVDGIHER